MMPPQDSLTLAAKVAGGGGVTAWLATANTAIAAVVGVLTIAVLLQTLWRNRKKKQR